MKWRSVVSFTKNKWTYDGECIQFMTREWMLWWWSCLTVGATSACWWQSRATPRPCQYRSWWRRSPSRLCKAWEDSRLLLRWKSLRHHSQVHCWAGTKFDQGETIRGHGYFWTSLAKQMNFNIYQVPSTACRCIILNLNGFFSVYCNTQLYWI